jgi:PAS domain-containing protein
MAAKDTEMAKDNNGVTAGDTAPSARTGWFRYLFDEESWEWSTELERLYGYQAGTVTPSTELIFSHEDPRERGRLAQLLQATRNTKGHFSIEHRMVDTRGRAREVVIAGDAVLDAVGAVAGLSGFYVDVTPPDDRAVQRSVTDAVTDFTERRAGIEQAKGMLMLVYDLTADAAFDLLKWRSQQTNTKLRALAEQTLVDFQACNAVHRVAADGDFDALFVTAHLRAARGDVASNGMHAESA